MSNFNIYWHGAQRMPAEEGTALTLPSVSCSPSGLPVGPIHTDRLDVHPLTPVGHTGKADGRYADARDAAGGGVWQIPRGDGAACEVGARPYGPEVVTSGQTWCVAAGHRQGSHHTGHPTTKHAHLTL